MFEKNPLISLSKAYHSAQMKDLPGYPVASEIGDPLILRPTEEDLDVTHFQQVWNSTRLGFEDGGRPGLTTAYTTVVSWKKNYAVYFGGTLAYVLTRPNEMFYKDLERRSLRSVRQSALYSARGDSRTRPQRAAR